MLFIRPIQAILTRETNLLLSMDPYLVILYEGQEFKTNPHFGGGNKPKWSETISFDIRTINILRIEAWSRAVISNDSLIGRGQIDLKRLLLIPGKVVQQYAQLFYEGKSAGKVLIEIAFTNQTIKKKLIHEQKSSEKLRSSLPEFFDLKKLFGFGNEAPKQQKKQTLAHQTNGFTFGYGGHPMHQKPGSSNQIYNGRPQQNIGSSEQQLSNGFAKMNINGVPVNMMQNGMMKQNGQIMGLPHNHLKRPVTPMYQGNYPLKHRFNNGIIQPQPQQMQNQHPQQGQQQSQSLLSGSQGSSSNIEKQDSQLKRQPSTQRQNHQMSSQNGERVGVGKTPPRSILSAGKKRSKSNKKVSFDV